MTDVFLYQGEASQNDVKLRDPTVSEGGAGTNGVLAVTLGAMVLASSAQVAVAGTVAQTLGTLIGTRSGTVDVKGQTAAQLAALALAGAGSAPVAGAGAPSLGTLGVSSQGTVAVSGSAGPTLGALTLNASGTVGAAPAVGQLSVTLGEAILTAQAGVEVQGVAAGIFGDMAVASSAQAYIAGLLPPQAGQYQMTGDLVLSATGTVSGPSSTPWPYGNIVRMTGVSMRRR